MHYRFVREWMKRHRRKSVTRAALADMKQLSARSNKRHIEVSISGAVGAKQLHSDCALSILHSTARSFMWIIVHEMSACECVPVSAFMQTRIHTRFLCGLCIPNNKRFSLREKKFNSCGATRAGERDIIEKRKWRAERKRRKLLYQMQEPSSYYNMKISFNFNASEGAPLSSRIPWYRF
jgi:hypothetical protein